MHARTPNTTQSGRSSNACYDGGNFQQMLSMRCGLGLAEYPLIWKAGGYSANNKINTRKQVWLSLMTSGLETGPISTAARTSLCSTVHHGCERNIGQGQGQYFTCAIISCEILCLWYIIYSPVCVVLSYCLMEFHSTRSRRR